MDFSRICGLCKKHEGSIRSFRLKKRPHKDVMLYKVICKDCMEPQEGETIEEYLSLLYKAEVTNES